MTPLSIIVCLVCVFWPRIPTRVRYVVLAVVLLDTVFGPQSSPPLREPRPIWCWDRNENYRCDPEEDINGDDLCTLNDCSVCPPNQPNCPLYRFKK
jgi:hypothetical protein